MADNKSRSKERAEFGRFDRSFFFRLVSSFLLLTLAVAAVEMGLRFGVVIYRFQASAPQQTEAAAERLASDVRMIMLNRGGPVAARTVYPILDRNFQRAGLKIAIQPSSLTVSAIESQFDFTPRGVPVAWPDGRHVEAKTELRAEEFCLQCHTNAAVGDVLGTVVVRDYLSTRLANYWSDVRLSGGLNVVKIILHTVILFFLLRTLMGPLMSLRASVARLARGEAGVSARAEVVSSDEFGDLTHDLNVFLDRTDQLLSDLEDTLSGVSEVDERLKDLVVEITDQVEQMEVAALDAGSARLVHRAHEVRHTVGDLAALENRMRQVATDGKRLQVRLAEADAPPSESEDSSVP